MQNRLDVDVHTRALRAAERVGPNGNTGELPDEPQPKWWRKYFKWENLTVAGREVKGWVVPQQLGIALIVLIISGAVGMYWRMDSKIEAATKAAEVTAKENRDLLIRLDQRLIDKDVHDKEKDEQFEKRFQNVEAVQIVLGRDIAKLDARKN